MKNSDYWKKRQEAKLLNAERDVKSFYDDLIKSFEKAKKDVHSVVNKFYIRYADNNELNYATAMEELNFRELKELKDELSAFRELSLFSIGEFNLELENMSMRARITRYQALEMQLNGILNNLYAINYEAYGKDKLIDIYKDQYLKTIFNIEQYQGFHQEFAQISNRAVEELINYPFSGASYSDRLWRQKDDLVFKLKDSIMNMIISGTNPSELSEEFAKHFNRKEYEAYRLLQMEEAFIVEQATLKGYTEDGIEEYEILATLDLKTSDICREQDGKVYKVSEAVTGVNSPPFHWYCRTTTMPYLGEGYNDERIARNPITNKTEKVPASMKYKEWYDKYVANDPKALIEEKKHKSKYEDKKQHDNYKKVLGKEVPSSFDDFQNMKYNDIEGYNILKGNFRKINHYNKVVVNEPQITLDLQDISDKTGTELVGLEYRLKTKESYLRKVNFDSNNSVDPLVIDDIMYNTKDIIRYTFQSSSNDLTEKYFQINAALSEMGYKQIKCKNSWLKPEEPYNGVNCNYQALNGQKFEIQYHTPESFELKNGELHKLYEEQRVIEDKKSVRYLELEDKMFELSDKLEVPKDIEKVK